MQLFTATSKVYRMRYHFFDGHFWAELVLLNLTKSLSSNRDKAQKTALKDDQQPATASAAFSSLHRTQAALPARAATTPHVGVQRAKAHLSASVGLNQTLVILNRVYCI